MSAFYIILTTVLYFLLLFAVSRKAGGTGDNDTFFRGGRRSPWWAVAFGMIGASLSGVSFVSVPGMVRDADMTYMQMCVGFFFGYLVVAFVLLPLYYKLNLTSIYAYLDVRFGKAAYRTGASGTVFLIWLYTFRGGIKSLVWTDALQTLCLVTALVSILYQLCRLNDFTVVEAVRHVVESPYGRWIEWDDWTSRQHFVKQFLSGIFIVIVMTGLDQDMMQKNLTCKNLHDAQKDMCSYGFSFIPLNMLFLGVGVLLLALASREGIDLPVKGDDILPLFCAEGHLGNGVLVLFTIGIIAAAFSSADSALTALTTSFCVDILDVERRFTRPEAVRKKVHGVIALLFVGFILCFEAVNDSSLIDAIYVVASYTYGPLLGLFAFGMFTRRKLWLAAVPWICVAAPMGCYLLDAWTVSAYGYRFGYELLMLNGLFTFVGLYAFSKAYSPDMDKR